MGGKQKNVFQSWVWRVLNQKVSESSCGITADGGQPHQILLFPPGGWTRHNLVLVGWQGWGYFSLELTTKVPSPLSVLH